MSDSNGKGSAKERAKRLQEELGIDVYARYPVELIERRMDRPPQAAEERKGWRPVEDGEERLYHCYLRHSWCFPICYAFAVLTRDGEIVSAPDGQPVPLKEEASAEILGVPQQRISEWRARLVARKLLRLEGNRVYPLPKPPDLTVEERLKYTCTRVFLDSDEIALPANFLNFINNLALDEDTCTRVRAKAVAICRTFNEGLSKLRAQKAQSFQDLCTEVESLCTRPPEPSTSGPGPVYTEPESRVHAVPINKERARASDLDSDLDLETSSSSEVSEYVSDPPTPTQPTQPPPTTPLTHDAQNPPNRKTAVEGQTEIAQRIEKLTGKKAGWANPKVRELAEIAAEKHASIADFCDFLEDKWNEAQDREYRVTNLAFFTTVAKEDFDLWFSQRNRHVAPPDSPAAHASPFTGEDLRRHLERCAWVLRKEPALLDVAASVERLASEAERHIEDLEHLESMLANLEDRISIALRVSVGEPALSEIREGVERELKPYRGKMTAEHLAMLERRYMDTALFERASLPRLSLFYLGGALSAGAGGLS